jgi:capsular polysaccharide transport system ATP-binding protein
MIKAENIVKRYKTTNGFKTVLDDVSFELPLGPNVGFLGLNGAGKSTLLRILGGAEVPSSGRIVRQGTVSWPIGFSGGFQGSMSGYDNLRFICRVYNADRQKVVDFVQDFSDLGEYLFMPVSSYSSGMRAKLAFGISMAINFDYYLVDEVTAVGDATFRRKCQQEFERRSERSTLVIVSHNKNTIQAYCEKIFVLHGGKLAEFDNVEEGIEFYEELQPNVLVNRSLKQ